MKNTFYFILGICLIVLTSATTVSVMTVKPATPKYVMVKYFKSDYSYAEKFISKAYSSGYILNKIERIGGESTGHFIVVMEKY